MARQADEAFAGYQASGLVPQDEGKRQFFWIQRWMEHSIVRTRPSNRAHERRQTGQKCMRVANTSSVSVPGAGAARSSRALLPKWGVMAMAAFGVVGLASVVLSRQGAAVEQHSAELSKQHSAKKGGDEGEVYGRHIYRLRVMAEFCCFWASEVHVRRKKNTHDACGSYYSTRLQAGKLSQFSTVVLSAKLRVRVFAQQVGVIAQGTSHRTPVRLF